MPLHSGTRLGPYEIVAPLGAGGMGEVYRARDSRLGRDVAIKVLPEGFARDPERLARFEAEARTVAALSHPSVLAIHDIGTEGGLTFAVTELIEGQSLRERLAEGPLSTTRTIALAVQICQGLAAAHDRGVIHRDLKPDNIMLTPDGRAKILDFGLAKRDLTEAMGSQSLAPTMAAVTEPGAVLGTMGYMSPEQVRGHTLDTRSDLFSFGVVLYEMLSGAQPFRGASAADTMTSILREDPPSLLQSVPAMAPGLARIVSRCLEKSPTARFRSAADLSFALEALSSSSSSGTPGTLATSAADAGSGVTFRRITYRNGHVASARFTPDGAGIVYGAAWDGRPHEILTSRIGSPESRSLGLAQGSLLSMSASGEMAVSLGYRHHSWCQASGTLARVALAGGGVRPLQKDVGHADWSPDGRTMAVIRYKDGRCLLEYPAGRVLHENGVWMSNCRVSPDGSTVAFGSHHRTSEGEADVCVVGADGVLRILAADMVNLSGLAWSPAGDEVWFSGVNHELRHGIWGASLNGNVRDVHIVPTRMTLHDVRSNGDVLIGMEELRTGLSVGTSSDAPEVDMTWFDGSVAKQLSADGRNLLLVEVAEAENPGYASYLRDFEDSAAVRIGDGVGTQISRDGEWMLAVTHHPRRALMLYPTGFGDARELTVEGIANIQWAGFCPDGQHAIVIGDTSEGPRMVFRVALSGGVGQRLWDEEVDFDRLVGVPISPDGEHLVLKRLSGEHVRFAWRSGVAEPLAALTANDTALNFDESGEVLFVSASAAQDRRIDRLVLASGERTPWRTPSPADRRGVVYVSPPVVAADGSRYAYSYFRVISNLYRVSGLGT